MSNTNRVLIVDDDEDIGNLLSSYLKTYGFETHVACDGPGMRQQLDQQTIDLIVMDVMLPETDRLALTREVRAQSHMPVIMLSARADHYDRVLGLENGADDYMTKPFEPRELVARIQSVLRRAATPEGPHLRIDELVNFNGWKLDLASRSLLAPGGLTVALSQAEFSLLNTFLEAPKRLLSREQLMVRARGHMAGAGERSIDLLVSRLRQKLARLPNGQDMIKTIRGQGYLLDMAGIRPGGLLPAGAEPAGIACV